MTVSSVIVDPKTRTPAQVYKRNGDTGVKVFTTPLKESVVAGRPFLNSVNGSAMNVSVTFSGTPEIIHNGGSSSAWDATAVQGTWDFTTGAVVTLTTGQNNDQALFEDSGAGSVNFASYTAVTGKINLTTFNPLNESINLSFALAGVLVGNTVNLNDYIKTGLLGSQQTFAIGKADFGISSNIVDDFRIVLVKAGGPRPTFAFDDIQIEAVGNPVIYKVEADSGTKLSISKLVFSIADTGTGGTAYAYDQIGAIAALTNGISINAISNGVNIFTANIKKLSDLLLSGGIIENHIDDGVDTYYSVGVNLFETTPVVLDSRDNDEMRIIISDNLSGLLEFRCFARCNEEKIE